MILIFAYIAKLHGEIPFLSWLNLSPHLPSEVMSGDPFSLIFNLAEISDCLELILCPPPITNISNDVPPQHVC